MEEKRIDHYLEDGEKVLWHGRAKDNDYLSCKMINMFPFVVLWLVAECVILGVSVTLKILGDFNVYYLILTIAAILLHLIPTAVWFVEVAGTNFRLKGEEYAVTDRRVIVLHPSSHENIEWASVKDVDDVILRRSFGELVLGTGRLEIEIGDDRIVFYSVEEAVKAHKRVFRAVNKEEIEKGE